MKLLFLPLILLACCALCPAETIRILPPQVAADRALAGDGKMMMVDQPGMESRFTLPSNPSTGYRWIASGGEGLAEVTMYPEEREASEAGAPRLVGAPGREIVCIKSLKPGVCEIVLQYARPWEKPLRPARTIRIELSIVALWLSEELTAPVQPPRPRP